MSLDTHFSSMVRSQGYLADFSISIVKRVLLVNLGISLATLKELPCIGVKSERI